MTDARTDVLVVGAGPVGLTAALELRRRGIKVMIVDRLLEPTMYAKAVGIQPRTLELWDAAGLARPALDACTPMLGQLHYRDGELVNRLELRLPEQIHYGFVAIPQYAVERLLITALADQDVRVRRGVEFVSAEVTGDGVTARLSTADGDLETVDAQYLIGCDGAHSAVRKALGIAFSGDAFPEQYMLADVEVDWSQPAGYAIRSNRVVEGGADDLMVCIPLPGDRRYRISSLVDPELAQDPLRRKDTVAHGLQEGPKPELRHIQAVLDRLAPEPTTASAMRWSSVFRISHRLADRYGSGRMFLAGDAAHIHPPTGAQGMNTGVQDAVNLAWKLALAVRGRAAEGLLDSYHAERHPVGAEVVGRTVTNARSGFEPPASGVEGMLLREAQMLVGYPDSPVVRQEDGDRFAGGAQAGERAPDATGLRQATARDPFRLHELFRHPGYTVLLWSADATVPPDVLAAVEVPGVRCYVLTPATDLPAGHVVVDGGGAFASAYGTGRLGQAMYVVRPDGYVGYRSADVTGTKLTHALRSSGLAR